MSVSSASRGEETSGLINIVKANLQSQMLQSCASKWNGDLVLIVDDSSVKIISKALGMYELMESKVYLVEQIKKKRAPYRKSAPIYFLSPNIHSIDYLIQDWTPNANSNSKEPLYADHVFVYFTKAVSNELFAKIKTCKPLLRRLKAFREINIDFIASQNNAFHLDMKSSTIFSKLYAPNQNPSAQITIAEKLVTLCASLNEYPHIRYKASSPLSSSVARIFNEKFNAFVGSNKAWWYHGDAKHTERGRSTLLLLSRQDDCLTPLIHEFTYQAMVHDLLPLEDDKITVEVPSENGPEKKDALLNENDAIWMELQGKHIADVIKILSDRIREIVHSNSGVAALGNKKEEKALSMTQMARALKNLPEYKEVMSKLSQHMHIAHRCMDIFNKKGLMDLSDLEQTLANGVNESGRSVKVADMVELVEEQLKSTDDSLARFRLIAIFITSQRGLRPTDQSRLFAAARLNPREAKALSNLETLGYPLLQSATGSSFSSPKLQKRNVSAESDIDYATSRYIPDLKEILTQNQTNTLSFTDYPSVYPMPDENSSSNAKRLATSGVSSVRNKTSKYSSRKHKSNAIKTRMIVFVAGGASYSELRSAQEVGDKGGQEIIMGSTHFVNPENFVHDLTLL